MINQDTVGNPRAFTVSAAVVRLEPRAEPWWGALLKGLCWLAGAALVAAWVTL